MTFALCRGAQRSPHNPPTSFEQLFFPWLCCRTRESVPALVAGLVGVLRLLTPCLVLASLRLLRSARSLVSQEYSGSVSHRSSYFNLRNHLSLGPNPTATQFFINCHPHQE